MKFIKLTRLKTNEIFYINMDLIVIFQLSYDESCTELYEVNENDYNKPYEVIETPEEILLLLSDKSVE